MRKSSWRAVAGILFLAWPALAVASIRGNYIETRSADVYTGPCFANGEMGIAGQEATLVWQIDKGDFNGVDLDGLSVVSVVKASATLGDPFAQPLPARAVMIVDRQASPEQKAGLVAFARAMGGDLMENVVRTETAPIRIELHHDQEGHIERAIVQVSDLVRIETRALSAKDHYCGNEITYYPPLSPTLHAMPAVALTDQFSGDGLGASWTLHDRRSAFVGTFSLD